MSAETDVDAVAFFAGADFLADEVFLAGVAFFAVVFFVVGFVGFVAVELFFVVPAAFLAGADAVVAADVWVEEAFFAGAARCVDAFFLVGVPVALVAVVFVAGSFRARSVALKASRSACSSCGQTGSCEAGPGGGGTAPATSRWSASLPPSTARPRVVSVS
ncbi:MAG: hypothetical protein ACTMHL_13890, partial [Janibacter sp.]